MALTNPIPDDDVIMRRQRAVLRAIDRAEGRMLPPGWDTGLEAQVGSTLTTGEPEPDRGADRTRAPLRLIKLPHNMPISFRCCGTGECGDLGCEGHPRNQGSALEERNDVDPKWRARAAWLVLAWSAAWLIGFGWWAFH